MYMVLNIILAHQPLHKFMILHILNMFILLVKLAKPIYSTHFPIYIFGFNFLVQFIQKRKNVIYCIGSSCLYVINFRAAFIWVLRLLYYVVKLNYSLDINFPDFVWSTILYCVMMKIFFLFLSYFHNISKSVYC